MAMYILTFPELKTNSLAMGFLHLWPVVKPTNVSSSRVTHYDQQYSHSVTSTNKIAGREQGCYSLGWFRQPPAVLPLRQAPWNLMVFQWLRSSSLRASGVRLQISSLENCRKNSLNDILGTKGTVYLCCERTQYDFGLLMFQIYRNSSPKNTNLLKMHSPSGHPVYIDEFVYSSKLAHQWILCCEWVPSELESKQLINISQ